ncbi:hypothetical protein [Piscinibacter sakaiensis]|uniref:hypothetical protein n=1 Tax=Piscinibacter sakaiensis TaxID=1547922 RepID=UPI003AAB9281
MLLLGSLLVMPAAAQTGGSAPATDGGRSLPLNWRIGIEQLKLPDGEQIGLVGASALVGVGNGWFAGPIVFGAASGQRGGLFVIGGEALWRTAGPAGSRIEAGLAIGGGGGAAAPVGSGLMLRPHLDWSWPVGPGWLGITASRVDFPRGAIASNQIGLVYSVDDIFRYQRAGSARSAGSGQRSGFGFDRFWLLAGQYRSKSGNHGYGGLRADHLLGNGFHVGIEAAGAAQGGADGYAEILGSIGKEWSLKTGPGPSALPAVGIRAAAGLGGGGAVDTGGGPLLKLAATLHWDLPHDLALGVEAGRTMAPDGSFRANHLHLALGLNLDRRAAGGRAAAAPADLRADTVEWAATLGHFPQMDYRNGSSDAVQTVGMRLSRRLSPALDEHLQLTGGIHFAAGGRAGAYGAGLIGLALATPLQQQGLHLGAEMLAGAAGGGGIDTRGGAVVQPMLRAGWADGSQRWRIGVGQIRSLRGDLRSPVVELSYGAAIGL